MIVLDCLACQHTKEAHIDGISCIAEGLSDCPCEEYLPHPAYTKSTFDYIVIELRPCVDCKQETSQAWAGISRGKSIPLSYPTCATCFVRARWKFIRQLQDIEIIKEFGSWEKAVKK